MAETPHDGDPPDSIPGVFSLERLMKSASRIRLPGGVIQKLSTVLIVTALSMGAICWNVAASAWWVPLFAIIVLGLLIYSLGSRMLSFAESNPYHAMLEGADLLVHQQLEFQMKGKTPLPFDPIAATSDPRRNPVLIEQDAIDTPDIPTLPKADEAEEQNNAE